jgi:hypothetical protein
VSILYRLCKFIFVVQRYCFLAIRTRIDAFYLLLLKILIKKMALIIDIS